MQINLQRIIIDTNQHKSEYFTVKYNLEKPRQPIKPRKPKGYNTDYKIRKQLDLNQIILFQDYEQQLDKYNQDLIIYNEQLHTYHQDLNSFLLTLFEEIYQNEENFETMNGIRYEPEKLQKNVCLLLSLNQNLSYENIFKKMQCNIRAKEVKLSDYRIQESPQKIGDKQLTLRIVKPFSQMHRFRQNNKLGDFILLHFFPTNFDDISQKSSVMYEKIKVENSNDYEEEYSQTNFQQLEQQQFFQNQISHIDSQKLSAQKSISYQQKNHNQVSSNQVILGKRMNESYNDLDLLKQQVLKKQIQKENDIKQNQNEQFLPIQKSSCSQYNLSVSPYQNNQKQEASDLEYQKNILNCIEQQKRDILQQPNYQITKYFEEINKFKLDYDDYNSQKVQLQCQNFGLMQLINVLDLKADKQQMDNIFRLVELLIKWIEIYQAKKDNTVVNKLSKQEEGEWNVIQNQDIQKDIKILDQEIQIKTLRKQIIQDKNPNIPTDVNQLNQELNETYLFKLDKDSLLKNFFKYKNSTELSLLDKDIEYLKLKKENLQMKFPLLNQLPINKANQNVKQEIQEIL
ncbi:hypothetical protein ABPG74_012458 [Tetrahymena malaccensis]